MIKKYLAWLQFLWLLVFVLPSVKAQITPPSYSNVVAEACTSFPSSAVDLPNITISETTITDIGSGTGSFTITLPTNFYFTGTPTVSETGTDIDSISIAISGTNTSVVVVTTTVTTTVSTDTFTLANLKMIAASAGATGTLQYRSGTATLTGMSDGYAFLSVSAAASPMSITGGTASGTQSLCLNSAATPISVYSDTTSLTGGTITYQWQQSVNNITFTNISGHTGTTYTPSTTSSGTIYYRRATIGTRNGLSCTDYSASVSVTVIDLDPGLIGSDQTICQGAVPSTLTSSRDALAGSDPITYTWQNSTDNGSTWANISGSGSTVTFTPSSVLTQTTWYRRLAQSSVCGVNESSNVIKVEVNDFPNSTLGIQFSNGDTGTHILCSDTNPSAFTDNSIYKGLGTITHVWQSSTDNGNTWTTASGTVTGTTYDPPTVTADIWYRRQSTSSLNSVDCVKYSNILKFDYGNSVIGGTASSNQIVCLNASVSTLTVSGATATGTLSYQWESSSNNLSWSTISGETGPSFTPSSTSTGTTYYRRTTTLSSDGQSCSNSSTSVSVEVIKLIAGTIAANQTVCYGDTPNPITSSTDASAGGAAITYSWQKSLDNGTSWSTISGVGATSSFIPGTVTQTTQFRRGATSGTCSDTLYSNAIEVIVNNFPNSTLSIAFNDGSTGIQYICATSDPAVLQDNSTLISTGTLTHTWQKSTDNGNTWASATGTISGVTYDPPSVSADIWYRRQSQSSIGGETCTGYTNILKFLYSNPTQGGTVSATQEVCYGGTLSQLTVSGATSTGILNYQWQSSTDNTSFSNISGATGTNYTPSSVVTGTTYYRRLTTLTDGGQNCPAPSTSVSITIKVTNPGSISASQTVCVGDSPATIFSIANASADGATITYKWQQSIDDGTSWADISSTNNASYTPSNSVTQTTWYRRVSWSSSCTASTTSNIHTLYINNFPNSTMSVAFFGGSTSDQDICPGGNPFPFEDNSTYLGTGEFTHQWEQSTNNGLSWSNASGSTATTATYDPPAVTQSVWYRRQTTRTYNGVSCTYLISNILKITMGSNVNPGEIQTSSANKINDHLEVICSGSTPSEIVSKTASTASGTLSYKWYKSTASPYVWSIISGATSETYQPSAITQTTYYMRSSVVTYNGGADSCGLYNDPNSIVTVLVPTVGTLMDDFASCYGDSPGTITEKVASTGTSYLTHQWQSSTDGSTYSDISSTAINLTYTPGALTQTTYFRRVTSIVVSSTTCTVVTTNPVKVTVLQTSAGSISGGEDICANDDPATINSATAGSGGATYQWVSSTDGSSWNSIAGATNLFYDPPTGLTTTTYFKRRATLTMGSVTCSTDTNSVTIKVAPEVVGGTLTANQTINSGGTPALLTVTGGSNLSGVTYVWQYSIDSGSSWITINTATSTTYQAGTLTQTTQYKRITNRTFNGISCSGTSNSITITINSISAGSIGTAQTICAATTPATLTQVSAATFSSGGTVAYNWEYSTDNSTFISIGSTDAVIYSPGSLNTTTYYRRKVTNTLNGVSNSAYSNVVAVTVTQLPVINNAAIIANDITAVSCKGGSDGKIDILSSRITGGTSAVQQINTVTVGGTPQAGEVFTLILDGTSFSHTITSGQTSSQIATSLTNLVNASTSAVVTANASTNVITLSADTAGTAFTIFADTGSSTTGTMAVVETQANALPNTYSWAKVGDSSFSASTRSITGLSAGAYRLTVTNNGCSVTSSDFVVAEPAVLDVAISTNCTNSLIATGSGGSGNYTYVLTHPNGATDSRASTGAVTYPSLVYGATYKVSISDNSCSNSIVKSFTMPSPVEIHSTYISTVDPSCSSSADGSITVSTGIVTGGVNPYSYSWTGPASFSSTSASISSLNSGVYNLTITDNIGCSATTSVTLTAKDPLAISSYSPALVQKLKCNGATDGTFGISYTSDPGANPVIKYYKLSGSVPTLMQSGASTDITGLGAGIYYVELSDGTGGSCAVTQTFTINEPAAFTATQKSVSSPNCYVENGGSAVYEIAGGTPPYKYTIDGGGGGSIGTASTTAATYTISNLAAGSHSISITDSNNCAVFNSTAVITIPLKLELSYDANADVTPIKCESPGSITVRATGGAGTNFYTWTGPNNYSKVGLDLNSVNDLYTPGNYTVFVTDKNQCQSAALTINIADTTSAFTVSGIINQEQCASVAGTGSIQLSISNNIVAPYTIKWFKWQLKDATNTGCTSNCFDWISIPNSDGKLTIDGLSDGEYRAVVEDSNTNACNKVTTSFTISKPVLEVYNTIMTSPSCTNEKGSYSFKLNSTNPVVFYLNGNLLSITAGTIQYNDATKRYTIPNLNGGTHTLRVLEQIYKGETVTDGCELFENFTLSSFFPITYAGETDLVIDICDVNLFPNAALIDGGTPFTNSDGSTYYLYRWTGNSINVESSSPLEVAEGSYELIIIDSNGCNSDPIVFNFTNNFDPITVSETIKHLSCSNSDDGSISVNIMGGKPPYMVEWEKEIPGTETNPNPTYAPLATDLLEVNNLSAGRYRLKVTSSFIGCSDSPASVYEELFTINETETIQILEGPYLSKSLCLGDPGILTIKVFDSQGGTFNFYYDDVLSSATFIGDDTYEVYINAPKDEAVLNIVNSYGCGQLVAVKTGVAEPSFTYTTDTYENTGVINANEDVIFTNTTVEIYSKMEWDFGDGSTPLIITAENAATTEIAHKYKTSGTFIVSLKLYNTQGCFKETKQEILIGKGYLVIFPTAFTPNDDGFNDKFLGEYTGVKSFVFEIFDMWGNKVFNKTVDDATTDQDWGWNGKYSNGADYEHKSFRYLFTAKTHDDKEIKKSGEATILR